MHATVRRYLPKSASAKEGNDKYRLLVRAYVPPSTLDNIERNSMAQFADDFLTPGSDWRVLIGEQDAVLRDIYSKSSPHYSQ
jgi:hypothetical protein